MSQIITKGYNSGKIIILGYVGSTRAPIKPDDIVTPGVIQRNLSTSGYIQRTLTTSGDLS